MKEKEIGTGPSENSGTEELPKRKASGTNMNELLYLIRMGDPSALRDLLKELEQPIEIRVCLQIREDENLRFQFEDMKQVASLSVLKSIDSYAEGKGTSFRTFALFCARRAITDYARQSRTQHQVNYGERIFIEDCEALSAHLKSHNGLGDPVYYLSFNEAKERLDRCYRAMKKKEKDVFHTWQKGLSYREGCQELGLLSDRQYEGRLRRVRTKVYEELLGRKPPKK